MCEAARALIQQIQARARAHPQMRCILHRQTPDGVVGDRCAVQRIVFVNDEPLAVETREPITGAQPDKAIGVL